MTRKEYFKLCMIVSQIPEGINNYRMVPAEYLVVYNGITYWPQGFEIRFTKEGPYDVAILHDLRANSVTRAELQKVRLFVGV